MDSPLSPTTASTCSRRGAAHRPPDDGASSRALASRHGAQRGGRRSAGGRCPSTAPQQARQGELQAGSPSTRLTTGNLPAAPSPRLQPPRRRRRPPCRPAPPRPALAWYARAVSACRSPIAARLVGQPTVSSSPSVRPMKWRSGNWAGAGGDGGGQGRAGRTQAGAPIRAQAGATNPVAAPAMASQHLRNRAAGAAAAPQQERPMCKPAPQQGKAGCSMRTWAKAGPAQAAQHAKAAPSAAQRSAPGRPGPPPPCAAPRSAPAPAAAGAARRRRRPAPAAGPRS